jgi:hypothetical protein
MLPGLRFLVAAIVFSFSVIVFGLGAAALFRAAHEQFASSSSWRATPETSFTTFLPQVEPPRPMIAMLRVEPVAPEPLDAPPPLADDENTGGSSTNTAPDAAAPAIAEISPPARPAFPDDVTVADIPSPASVDAPSILPAPIAPTEVASPAAVPATAEATVPASPPPESAVPPVTVTTSPVTIETAAIPPVSAPGLTEGQVLAGADVATGDEPTESQLAVAPRQDPIALKLAALAEQLPDSERTASLKTASQQLRQSLAKKRLAKARLAKERLADARRARQRQMAQRARAARNAAVAQQQQQQLQQQQYANPFAQPQGFGQQSAFGQQAAERTR